MHLARARSVLARARSVLARAQCARQGPVCSPGRSVLDRPPVRFWRGMRQSGSARVTVRLLRYHVT